MKQKSGGNVFKSCFWGKLKFILFLLIYYVVSTVSSDDTAVVITLSDGRSGSTFITDVLENLYGAKTLDPPLSHELFGSGKNDMMEKRNHTQFMIDFINKQRKSNPKSIVAGFKWKPYIVSKGYDKAWKYVASQGWIVVHNTRNWLDVFISHSKHKQFDVAGHCAAGNKNCLHKSENALPYINVSKALQYVDEAIIDSQRHDYFLRTLGVPLYEVRYEDFAFGSKKLKLHHLQNLCDFLLYPAHKKVSMKMLSTETVATSDYSQKEKVKNWQELYDKFKDSRYAYLLRT